jgi:hypothetical protein
MSAGDDEPVGLHAAFTARHRMTDDVCFINPHFPLQILLQALRAAAHLHFKF